MQEIKWVAGTPLKSAALIGALEQAGHFKLPDELRELIIQHNGASPLLGGVKLPNDSGITTDFNRLLSYNPGEGDTIYHYIKHFVKIFKGSTVPFGTDSFSHFFCYRLGFYCYYDPFTGKTVPLADNLDEFFSLFNQE